MPCHAKLRRRSSPVRAEMVGSVLFSLPSRVLSLNCRNERCLQAVAREVGSNREPATPERSGRAVQVESTSTEAKVLN